MRVHLVVQLKRSFDVIVDSVHVMHLKVQQSQRDVVLGTRASERVHQMSRHRSHGELHSARAQPAAQMNTPLLRLKPNL